MGNTCHTLLAYMSELSHQSDIMRKEAGLIKLIMSRDMLDNYVSDMPVSWRRGTMGGVLSYMELVYSVLSDRSLICSVLKVLVALGAPRYILFCYPTRSTSPTSLTLGLATSGFNTEAGFHFKQSETVTCEDITNLPLVYMLILIPVYLLGVRA